MEYLSENRHKLMPLGDKNVKGQEKNTESERKKKDVEN
jgi:hypothetical protein